MRPASHSEDPHDADLKRDQGPGEETDSEVFLAGDGLSDSRLRGSQLRFTGAAVFGRWPVLAAFVRCGVCAIHQLPLWVPAIAPLSSLVNGTKDSVPPW